MPKAGRPAGANPKRAAHVERDVRRDAELPRPAGGPAGKRGGTKDGHGAAAEPAPGRHVRAIGSEAAANSESQAIVTGSGSIARHPASVGGRWFPYSLAKNHWLLLGGVARTSATLLKM